MAVSDLLQAGRIASFGRTLGPRRASHSKLQMPNKQTTNGTNRQMKRLTGSIAFAVATAATVAMAHNGAKGVVLERMNGMTAIRDLMRELSPMMQGAVPYDPIQVSEAGFVIASHAGETMRKLFPTGSLEGVTYAKPNIWAEWDEFSTLADELRVNAQALSQAAPTGLEPVVAAISGTQPVEMIMATTQGPDRSQQIAALMGYAAPRIVEVAPAMTTARPATSRPAVAEIGAGKIFERITGTCSACHSRFRKGRS